jgi:hypothetical protein
VLVQRTHAHWHCSHDDVIVSSEHMYWHSIITVLLVLVLTGSLLIAAVRPTPEEPLPVVYTPRGATDAMYFSSCDLATPGSPIKQMFMSPLFTAAVAAVKRVACTRCRQHEHVLASKCCFTGRTAHMNLYSFAKLHSMCMHCGAEEMHNMSKYSTAARPASSSCNTCISSSAACCTTRT